MFVVLFVCNFINKLQIKTGEPKRERPNINGKEGSYTIPCAIIASATFSKPAMFAPIT